MSSVQATSATKFRVGVFSVLAMALLGAITVFVNDRPYWWRPCELVNISVDDATGLKTKSPVRSLGLQIGYLKSVALSETHVRLGICITAPVEVLPTTRAYIRPDGFLGDRFVELKPVRYLKGDEKSGSRVPQSAIPLIVDKAIEVSAVLWGLAMPSAMAAPEAPQPPTVYDSREIPVGEKGQDVEKLVRQVDGLVNEMTSLTNNLKEAINPAEMKQTMNRLNKTLENASRTLSPEGGLNTTAQRTLVKLEDAIEQMRDQLSRINRGEGSLGMVLNDSSFANELMKALQNVNVLLGRVKQILFIVDMSIDYLPAHPGPRGAFRLGIWPAFDRYYLVGVSVDPRGKVTEKTTTEVVNGVTTVTHKTKVEPTGLLFTVMLGKVLLSRYDFSAGILNSDGAASVAFRLGPSAREDLVVLRNDIYGGSSSLDYRFTASTRPWVGTGHLLEGAYLRAGIDSVRSVNGKFSWFFGAGLTFSDEDVRLLFAFK